MIKCCYRYFGLKLLKDTEEEMLKFPFFVQIFRKQKIFAKRKKYFFQKI